MLPIRTATELDIPAITEIYAYYVAQSAATFETDTPNRTQMERRRAEILSLGFPYLVAEIDGRVTGYAYASHYRTRPAYRFSVEDSVYIHPDFHRLGLGRALLTRVIELCTAAGHREMVAIIGDSANVASIRLHEALGFRNVGVLESVGRKFGRWFDTVIMQRSLADGGSVSELKLIVDAGGSRIDILQRAAEFIRRSGNHRWSGIYDVDHVAGQVRNIVFDGPGPPAHPNFSINKGLTAVAIREKRTVNIGDVNQNPQYLTAFRTTLSEIIVPVVDRTRNLVIGTIDVESENLSAFTDRDEIFLENCAELLRPLWDTT